MSTNYLNRALTISPDEVIYKMIDAGETPNGETFNLAIKRNNPNILSTIIELGAKPNESSLYLAIKTDNLDIVKLVVGAGALPTDDNLSQSAFDSKNKEVYDFIIDTFLKNNVVENKERFNRLYYNHNLNQGPFSGDRYGSFVNIKSIGELITKYSAVGDLDDDFSSELSEELPPPPKEDSGNEEMVFIPDDDIAIETLQDLEQREGLIAELRELEEAVYGTSEIDVTTMSIEELKEAVNTLNWQLDDAFMESNIADFEGLSSQFNDIIH